MIKPIPFSGLIFEMMPIVMSRVSILAGSFAERPPLGHAAWALACAWPDRVISVRRPAVGCQLWASGHKHPASKDPPGSSQPVLPVYCLIQDYASIGRCGMPCQLHCLGLYAEYEQNRDHTRHT